MHTHHTTHTHTTYHTHMHTHQILKVRVIHNNYHITEEGKELYVPQKTEEMHEKGVLETFIPLFVSCEYYYYYILLLFITYVCIY